MESQSVTSAERRERVRGEGPKTKIVVVALLLLSLSLSCDTLEIVQSLYSVFSLLSLQ